MAELSRKLKEARVKLGLSQSQAAKEWRVNLWTLRQWEQAKHEPRGLGATIMNEMLDRILSDTGHPPPPPGKTST